METINFTRGVPANESFPIARGDRGRDGRAQDERGGCFSTVQPPVICHFANGWPNGSE